MWRRPRLLYGGEVGGATESDPDVWGNRPRASPSFVLYLDESFAVRLSVAAGGSDRRPEAVGQRGNKRLRIVKMHIP
jgi:hypothetical protein